MLHDKWLLCLSDNKIPAVPHSAHSLRRTGGEGGLLPILECITRGEVQYLAQQDTKSTWTIILKLLISIRNNREQRKNIKTTIE